MKSGVFHALSVVALCGASPSFAKLLVGPASANHPCALLCMGSGIELLARLQVLGNCAIRLLVK